MEQGRGGAALGKQEEPGEGCVEWIWSLGILPAVLKLKVDVRWEASCVVPSVVVSLRSVFRHLSPRRSPRVRTHLLLAHELSLPSQ